MGYLSAEVKSMKEWALYYAELGLAVFPLAYRNKVPAIEGGCKAATTEKSKIERWWNQNPRYNIGIATGNKSNGLVVIDLDVDKNKGIDGYEVLRDWQNKHGELPETWQSITGRGGYHYFYKDTITHAITNKQVEELWALVEADETAGKSNSEMYDSMVQKLGEYGVSAEKATQILEQYGAQAGVSSAFVEEMTGKVQALGKGFSESSSTIDTSSITVKESIKGIRSVLYDLSVSSSEYAGTYRGVLEVFNNTSGSAANAQDAFNIVYNALKEAGVPLDELNKKLAQEFPSAAQATKSSVDSSIVEAQKTVSSSMVI